MNWLRQIISRASAHSDAIRGGLALPRNKPGLPVSARIDELDVPAELVIPLLNYLRETCAPLVKVGDIINLGDPIAADIIASACGVVIAVEKRPVVHPSQRLELCVVIATDANQAQQPGSVYPAQKNLTLERIENCGIHGLGGAGFNTASKFQSCATHSDGIDTLIINAVECEPMVSCDEALMMTQADEIIKSIHSLIGMTHCQRCILAIEDDKAGALTQIRRSLDTYPKSGDAKGDIYDESVNSESASSDGQPGIELQLLAPVYPSGAERPLIERLTDVRLSGSEKPVEHGIVCINIATALAAWYAQRGDPLISRVITVAGEYAQNPINVRVRFGTRISDVLKMTGNTGYPQGSRIRVGGPLSGFDIDDLSAPITATSNCIAIEAPTQVVPPSPCIRCGACSDVCPAQLLPQQLYWYARSDDVKNSSRFGLDSCIACGCCDVVCPSSIPLTQTFRHAQDTLREQSRQAQFATLAEQRFEQRELRQAARELLRKEKREAARERLQASSGDPIADALKRAQKRRRASRKTGSSHDGTEQSNGDTA